MSVYKYAAVLFKLFWEWRLLNAPELATSIGTHKYDDRLDEMSLNSYLRRRDEGKVFLEQLKQFRSGNHSQDISPTVELNIELLISDLEQFVAGMEFKAYLRPLNILEGPQLDFPRLLTWMKKDTVEDYSMILNRLRLFPQQVREIISLLREGIRLNQTMNSVSIQPVVKVMLNMSEMLSLESPLFKPFVEKPNNISDENWTSLVNEAKKIIEDDVNPSYKSLSSFISDEYLNYTRPFISASSLPNGLAYYKACLKFHTTTDLTPKEIHDIGLNEVARITKRMEELKEKVKFEGSLPEFRAYLRTDSKFNFKNASEIINLYKSIGVKIESKLNKYFKVLPKARYVVTPVPAEVAPTFPGAYYLAPPDDGSRPGIFYVNTYKPESRKRYEVVALCLHESIPGHHLQASLTMEKGSCPSFRRFMEDRKYYEPPGRFAMNTAYTEGWALYSEYLGEEMGLYGDPFNLFGRLSHEMLRACRLVVDTGMHAFGWSREMAIKYMEENTASDIHDIISEVNRYITWPGQACGYKIGELKIKELRAKCEKELGEKFDIRSFHHLIASMGGVPLNILEKQIDIFVQNQLKTEH